MDQWEWNMLRERGACPRCATVQVVEIEREQPCIECLAMFTYTPTADEDIDRMTPQQRKNILSLANNLAVDVKEDGHDLFVWYSPHIEQVTLDLYIGGWAENAEPTLTRYLDLHSESNHSDAVNTLVEVLAITQKESENE